VPMVRSVCVPTPSTSLRAGSSQKTRRMGHPRCTGAGAKLGHPPALSIAPWWLHPAHLVDRVIRIARILQAVRVHGVIRILQAVRVHGIIRIQQAVGVHGIIRILQAVGVHGVIRILQTARVHTTVRIPRGARAENAPQDFYDEQQGENGEEYNGRMHFNLSTGLMGERRTAWGTCRHVPRR
jgi:hypothetical protein